MSLSSSHLDAFVEVARSSSFSRAATILLVTQSALSQRIKNLETELGHALFIRESTKLRLTPAGEELLQYCKNRSSLENECLARIQDPHTKELTGSVRIGAYSSVMRSLVMPSLQSLVASSPRLKLELMTRELRELPQLLRSGEADYVLWDRPVDRSGVESELLGSEELVMVEAKGIKTKSSTFLDHDSDDDTTQKFLQAQGGKLPKIVRSYLDDIYGVIDGAALGFGRAVVPRHLIQADKRLQIVAGYKPVLVPVYINSYSQAFRSRLHEAVMECLTVTLRRSLRQRA
jgi:DNA-binding transcriptional LysR family regulator